MPREDQGVYSDRAIDLTRSDSVDEEVEETFEAVDRGRRYEYIRPSGKVTTGSPARPRTSPSPPSRHLHHLTKPGFPFNSYFSDHPKLVFQPSSYMYERSKDGGVTWEKLARTATPMENLLEVKLVQGRYSSKHFIQLLPDRKLDLICYQWPVDSSTGDAEVLRLTANGRARKFTAEMRIRNNGRFVIPTGTPQDIVLVAEQPRCRITLYSALRLSRYRKYAGSEIYEESLPVAPATIGERQRPKDSTGTASGSGISSTIGDRLTPPASSSSSGGPLGPTSRGLKEVHSPRTNIDLHPHPTVGKDITSDLHGRLATSEISSIPSPETTTTLSKPPRTPPSTTSSVLSSIFPSAQSITKAPKPSTKHGPENRSRSKVSRGGKSGRSARSYESLFTPPATSSPSVGRSESLTDDLQEFHEPSKPAGREESFDRTISPAAGEPLTPDREERLTATVDDLADNIIDKSIINVENRNHEVRETDVDAEMADEADSLKNVISDDTVLNEALQADLNVDIEMVEEADTSDRSSSPASSELAFEPPLRIGQGKCGDLIPELDEVYDGGRNRTVMRYIEEDILDTSGFNDDMYILMITWNRYAEEFGPIQPLGQLRYLDRYYQKYGRIILKIKGTEQTMKTKLFDIWAANKLTRPIDHSMGYKDVDAASDEAFDDLKRALGRWKRFWKKVKAEGTIQGRTWSDDE